MNHPLFAEWRELRISYRIAAEETGISKSVICGFLRGQRNLGRRSNPEPILRAYIESKKPSLAVASQPLAKKLFGLGLTVKDAVAGLAGLKISKGDLYRYLSQGRWPNQETLDTFRKWLDDQKERRKKKMLTKISLTEEVLDHFGLKRDPFTNEMESAEDIFDMRELSRAEKKILVAVDKNGWAAVTGEVGSGKTTLLKRIEQRLSRRKDVVIVKPRIIEKQYLGASHVCDSILQDLGTHMVLSHRTLEHKARLVGRTLEEAYRDGKKVVVLIDEAHLLRDEALLALKRIYEFEIGFKKLLSIVLLGQIALARRLKSNFNLGEVSQRVDLYELGNLNGAVGAYIEHKLSRAGLNGAGREIFDKAALRALGERGDTPLSVNNLASLALITAHDLSEKHVTAEIVKGIQGGL